MSESSHIFIHSCNFLTWDVISCKTSQSHSDDSFHAIILVGLSKGAITLPPSVNISWRIRNGLKLASNAIGKSNTVSYYASFYGTSSRNCLRKYELYIGFSWDSTWLFRGKLTFKMHFCSCLFWLTLIESYHFLVISLVPWCLASCLLTAPILETAKLWK